MIGGEHAVGHLSYRSLDRTRIQTCDNFDQNVVPTQIVITFEILTQLPKCASFCGSCTVSFEIKKKENSLVQTRCFQHIDSMKYETVWYSTKMDGICITCT